MEQNKTVTNFEYLKPPKEAYLHFPKENRLYSGKEKKILRWYFDGDSEYTEFELQRLQKFKDYLKEKGATNLIDNWTQQEIFRQLQGNYFDNKKTKTDIADFNEWVKNVATHIDDDIQKFLDLEIIYVAGRDHKYRPIIVFNIFKLDPKQFPIDKITKGVDFFYKIIMDNMFIPGQIENWIIIMDLNSASLSSIPLSMIKQIVSYSSKYYKSRLYRLYMVNTTSTITTTWKALKFFMDSVTVDKINILKEGVPEKLFLHANKSQVPEKFGGNLKQIQYWPPKVNDEGPFNVEGVQQTEDFISIPEYQSKVIREGVVCKELMEQK